MSNVSLPLTRLIHENLSVLMTFAFSRGSLQNLRRSTFEGDWEYLDFALFELSEIRAQKACLELAVFLRVVDDDVGLNERLRELRAAAVGRVLLEDGSVERLYLRDMTNKIMHASALSWDFTAPESPLLVCEGRDPKRWLRAEISIVDVAGHCGMLIS